MKKIYYLITLLAFVASTTANAQGLNLTSGAEFQQRCGLTQQSEKWGKSFVDKKGRFRLDSKTNESAVTARFTYDLNQSQDYSIEAKLEQVDSNDEKGYGIIFGFKDWDNYSIFYISGNKYYKLITCVNGMSVPSKWKYCSYLNFGDTYNYVKIWKHGNKFIFAINGTMVDSEDSYTLPGNQFGFVVGGKGQFALDNFKITDYPDNDSPASSNSLNNLPR